MSFLLPLLILGCAPETFTDEDQMDAPSKAGPFEQWQEDGSLDIQQRANTLWKKMLADYQAPSLDEATDEALQAFIAQRKKVLSGTGDF